jgi:hypothetical protein
MPDPELQTLFHRLNNQLGIVLARAELMEARAADEAYRSGSAQIVSAVLEALRTIATIRERTDGPSV